MPITTPKYDLRQIAQILSQCNSLQDLDAFDMAWQVNCMTMSYGNRILVRRMVYIKRMMIQRIQGQV